MDRFFTKTFSRFFFGFLGIIIIALAVLIAAGYIAKEQPTSPVDNTATPQ